MKSLQPESGRPPGSVVISIRESTARLYRRRLFNRVRNAPIDERASAIFFAPHPDDETLGCGGTIAKKCHNGADVSVVVLTDGRQSHAKFVGETKLVEMRAGEVRAATRALGLAPENLFLLGYPDGALADHAREAESSVSRIILDKMPAEIFLPFRGDRTEDHVSTYEIVVRAARATNFAGLVYEYPVWFWMQWPFCELRYGGKRELPGLLSSTLISNIRLLYSFAAGCSISDFTEIKRGALNEHRSQMTRVTGDEAWPILADVSGGEFLSCFLQSFEVFCRSRI